VTLIFQHFTVQDSLVGGEQLKKSLKLLWPTSHQSWVITVRAL